MSSRISGRSPCSAQTIRAYSRGGTVEFAQALAPDGSADARILDLGALNAALQKDYRNPHDDAILRVHQPASATSLGEVPTTSRASASRPVWRSTARGAS